MRTKRHWVLYVTALPWDLVGWIAVLLLWVFWGKNLRWERKPSTDDTGRPFPDGYCLACDLKADSWPTRTWYRRKIAGKYRKLHDAWPDKYGTWRTWGGTTLAPHAIFYGPGKVDHDKVWDTLREHEHVHSEQGEAAMMRSFIVGVVVFIVMASFGNPRAAAWLGGVIWVSGNLMNGVANWFTAWLRGEDPYRGSHHEEAAYAIDDDYGS